MPCFLAGVNTTLANFGDATQIVMVLFVSPQPSWLKASRVEAKSRCRILSIFARIFDSVNTSFTIITPLIHYLKGFTAINLSKVCT
jgi:hypothetical protein